VIAQSLVVERGWEAELAELAWLDDEIMRKVFDDCTGTCGGEGPGGGACTLCVLWTDFVRVYVVGGA